MAVPKPVDRPRQRQLMVIPPEKVIELIERGARIVVFQKFMGESQSYLTVLADQNAHYLTLNPRPEKFIIAAGKPKYPPR